MTLDQIRLFTGLVSDGVTSLVQGAEQLMRQLEVYEARDGMDAIVALKADHPEAADEIDAIIAQLNDVAPVVAAVQTRLMDRTDGTAGNDIRERLMRLRADA